MSFLLLFFLLIINVKSENELHLTTDDEGYLTVIQGFATQLQCVLNTCSPNVVWYKDDLLLYNSTHFVPTDVDKSYKLQHKVEVDLKKGCSGKCSDNNNTCLNGQSCVDNQCCHCAKEEFTLILRNLTFDDSGRYRCQIENQSELLEFQVEVLESGLKGGFHENISYDHSECCQKKGISPLCRSMCKPSEMAQYHFDPTSCKTDDYKNFLSCATDNGTRSHVHCCKTQLVPSFCYDFCSGDFQMLRRSHRLCLYYLPEIFECYNRAYLPFPDPPDDVIVNAIEHDQLSVCWKKPKSHPSNIQFPIVDYTVFYKEIPNFPLLGADVNIPLLSGDYSDIGDIQDEDYADDHEEEPHDRTKRHMMPSINIHLPINPSENDLRNISEEIRSSRNKRATMLIVTKDEKSNSTSVREFNFLHINTTSTCQTLINLRSATRYIVYVISRNEYGTSVPSIRSIATTNPHVMTNNESLPDSMECCKANDVSSYCASKMCNVTEDPNPFATISIATTCRNEWSKVSPCIADGRNHTDCCVRKGVQGDCLGICSGSNQNLGVHSVLCLNLDLQAIYQCLREGYESHPSAPVNVTIGEITETTVEILWDEPEANAHLVETYTIFIRKIEHGAPTKRVYNAVSPHTEIGLDADSEYGLTIQSFSKKGESLPSTEILFHTLSSHHETCSIGQPLLISDGRLFRCGPLSPCPSGFYCISDEDESFCCQKSGLRLDSDFQECCQVQNMSHDCIQNCNYNSTLPDTCKDDLNKWIQCASGGMDHSRCCVEEDIPKECRTACRHPFQVPDTCISHVSSLMVCFAVGHNGLPDTVKNVELTSIRSDGATVSWQDIDMDVHLFYVDLYSGNKLISRNETTVDTFTLKELLPSTNYTVRVIAKNEHGESPPSLNVTFITLPSSNNNPQSPIAPEGLKIDWNYGTRVNLTWNNVTENRNGEKMKERVEYTVYYVDSENTGSWTQIKTYKNWIVLSELKRDSLYSVYLTASINNATSKSSSIITLLAQPDALSLPEPKLSISPERESGIYSLGEKIIVNCSLETNKPNEIQIDLSIGSHTAPNNNGESWVYMELTADSSIDTTTCTASKTDGRQSVVMRHILVKFGPIAKMDKSIIYGLDDDGGELTCTVKAFPAPNIRFEKDGKIVKGDIRIRLVSINTYKAVWQIKNVEKAVGRYKCIAEKDGMKSEDYAQVMKAKLNLPVNPRLILTCCENEAIEGECLQACSTGSAPPTLANCNKYSDSLLKCADDNLDHSDCCASLGVPSRCLPLCSGDSHTSSMNCSSYAVSIISCFVKGHERSPSMVTNVSYEVIRKGRIKLRWQTPKNTEINQYYAIYYRKEDDEKADYKMLMSTNGYKELDIDSSSSYDIGVMSANVYGHSPLTYIQIPSTTIDSSRRPSGGNSTSLTLLLIFLAVLILIGVIVVARRRDLLPSKFQSLLGGTAIPLNHPTVAFENPAYVAGNEVEIRGLGGHSDPSWQSAQLEASDEVEYGHGTRYAKLES